MRQLEQTLYAKLTAAPAVAALVGDRVYRGRAPEGATFPYVVFFKSAGTRSYTFNRAVLREHVYTVKAVGQGTDATGAQQVDEACEAALTDGLDGTALAGAGVVVHCRRQTDVEYQERDAAVEYQHVGGTYRVTVAL